MLHAPVLWSSQFDLPLTRQLGCMYSTVQHGTVQYSTVQYNTVQGSTGTVHCSGQLYAVPSVVLIWSLRNSTSACRASRLPSALARFVVSRAGACARGGAGGWAQWGEAGGTVEEGNLAQGASRLPSALARLVGEQGLCLRRGGAAARERQGGGTLGEGILWRKPRGGRIGERAVWHKSRALEGPGAGAERARGGGALTSAMG